jgi:hypothetical protein
MDDEPEIIRLPPVPPPTDTGVGCTTCLRNGEPIAAANVVAQNPGWGPPKQDDWRTNTPQAPWQRLFAGEHERDNVHVFIAMIVSGVIFVLISELVYGKSKCFLSTGKKLAIRAMAAFYVMHNVVIIAHRYYYIQLPALYEGLWVCSMALPLASVGILTQRYHLIAAALASILAGHVIWAFDTCLMLSHGDLTRTVRTLGIADYVNADGKITVLSVWSETHHLWFIPTSILLLRLTETPFRLREVTYGTVWYVLPCPLPHTTVAFLFCYCFVQTYPTREPS